MNKAFVISCKESKYITDCVDHIRRHYPSDDLFIIDSCSNNKSYFNKLSSYPQVTILDICNKNYEYGAYLSWHKLYGEHYDVYIFMQDSIMINSPIFELENIANDKVFVFSKNSTGWNTGPYHRNYWYERNPSFPVTSATHILMTIWNSFMITKQTFHKVIHSKIFELSTIPDNKILSCAWERVWSIIFDNNNISIHSIDNSKITKIFGNRQ